ncbi:DUF2290 domain-containing protein [Persephonella sp.]
MLHKKIFRQIEYITKSFIEESFSIDQNFPKLEKDENKNICEISWINFRNVSFSHKDESYEIIYINILKERDFNILMLDGSVIQMLYRFDNSGNSIKDHILAFYPHYSFVQYQDMPDEYESKLYGVELFSEIQTGKIATFPLRFDYSHDNHTDVIHPKSHLTLGNYKSCRIPVSKPITPYKFIKFILMNFYSNLPNNKFKEFADNLSDDISFEETITKKEKEILHIHYE